MSTRLPPTDENFLYSLTAAKNLTGLTLGVGVLCLSALAQAILPVDTLTDPDPGWSGQVSAALNGATGNSPSQDIALDALARHRRGDRVWLMLSDFNRQETFDTRTADDFSLHLRHIGLQQVGPTIDRELFGQWSYNDFQDLQSRGLLGAGIRWRPFQPQASHSVAPNGTVETTRTPSPFEGHFGLGGFYERESRESVSETVTTFRLNLYAKLTWKHPSPEHPFTAWTRWYVQPSIEALSDIRAIASAGISFPLLRRLDFSISTGVSYDGKPFTDVKRTDTEYQFKLSYAL